MVFAPLAPVVQLVHIPFTLGPADALVVLCAAAVVWGAGCVYSNRRYEHVSATRAVSVEYASRVVSFAHAMLSITFCVIAVLDEAVLFADWGRFGVARVTGWQQLALLCSAGYFLADFMGIVLFYWDTLFVIHHIVAGGCLAFSGITGVMGFETCLALGALEASNPFLHGRWLLLTSLEELQQKQQRLSAGVAINSISSSSSSSGAADGNGLASLAGSSKGGNSAFAALANSVTVTATGATAIVLGGSTSPTAASAASAVHAQKVLLLQQRIRVADDLFFIVFFTMRLLLCPVMTWTVLVQPTVPVPIKLSSLVLQFASVHFFVAHFQKRLRGEKWK